MLRRESGETAPTDVYKRQIKTDTFAGGRVELLKFQLPPDSQLVDKQLMEDVYKRQGELPEGQEKLAWAIPSDSVAKLRIIVF